MFSHAGFLIRSSAGRPEKLVKEAQSSPFYLIAAILGGPVVTILLVCIKSNKKTTKWLFLSTNINGTKPSRGGLRRGHYGALGILFQPNR